MTESYEAVLASNGIIFILNFMKIVQLFEKFKTVIRHVHTHTPANTQNRGDFITTFLLLQKCQHVF